MKLTRTQAFIGILAILTVAIAIVTNIATEQMPEFLKPYLWLSWPALLVLILIFVIVSVMSAREESAKSAATPMGLEPEQLAALIRSLISDSPTETQRAILGMALETGRLVTGTTREIGPDNRQAVNGVAVEGNRVVVYATPETDRIIALLAAIQTSLQPRSFLTHAEFLARTRLMAAAVYDNPLVQRAELLEQLRKDLSGSTQVIILHGPGGVGKTRLLLSLPDLLPSGTHIVYTRNAAESADHDIRALDPSLPHIVAVDDAHAFEPLPHLREALTNPALAVGVKLVLVTRSIFKESVVDKLRLTPGIRIAAIEVKVFSNAEMDTYLKNPPYSVTDQVLRHRLIILAEGNPFVAGVAARVVANDTDLSVLTRDRVLNSFLEQVIHDLAEAGYGERYLMYLQLAAALGTIEMDNRPLSEAIHAVVRISRVEEDRIVSDLVGAGLLERYWMTLKVSSGVLADHLLSQRFFSSTTEHEDFRTMVLDPFFAIKPKEIISTLARAESRGDSPRAALLLDQVMKELTDTIAHGSSAVRLRVLESIESVAYLRPDDALVMVERIVDGPEPAGEPDAFGWTPRKWHALVLDKAVDALSHMVYRGSRREIFSYLRRLAVYMPAASDYALLRKNAQDALIDIAEWKPGKPYSVQEQLAEEARAWLQVNLSENLDVATAVLSKALSLEITSVEADVIQPFTVHWGTGVLPPSEPLRQIRTLCLDTLFEAYSRATNVSERLTIVHCLDAAVPAAIAGRLLPAEVRQWLQDDCVLIARLIATDILPSADLPVIDAVSEWLAAARQCAPVQVPELQNIQQLLRSHRLYGLYRSLIGWQRWEEVGDEELNWKRAEELRRQAVDEYVDSLTPAGMPAAIRDLEVIAAAAKAIGESGVQWFNTLLQKMGETQAACAHVLIQQSMTEDLTLKQHIGFVVSGIRIRDRDEAWSYIDSWVHSADPVLWSAVTTAYRFVDWKTLTTEEWDVLKNLVSKESPEIDHQLVSLTPRFSVANQRLAIDVLRAIARRGDEPLLNHGLTVLALRKPGGNSEWMIECPDPDDLLAIAQNLDRLPSLDFHALEFLNRLGQDRPMEVIDILEKRIRFSAQYRQDNPRYDAIPFHFERAFVGMRSRPEFPQVLRRVKNWMLDPDPLVRYHAADLLNALSGLTDPLYTILSEWIQTEELERVKAVATLLHKCNSGEAFYSLLREIVLRFDEPTVIGSVEGAIFSTPGFIKGPMSNYYRQRISELAPWLQDENVKVRVFAQRLIKRLETDIESDNAQEALERRSW